MKNKKNTIKNILTILIVILPVIFMINKEVKREPLVNNHNLIGEKSSSSILSIDKTTLLKKLDKDTSVILISNDIKEINNVTSTLYSLALEYERDVYYYDITTDEANIVYENGKVKVLKNSSKFYKKLLESLGSFSEVYTLTNENGEKIDSGYKKIYTPFVIFVNKGNIVYSFYLKEEYTNSELKEIYKKGFELLDKNLLTYKNE